MFKNPVEQAFALSAINDIYALASPSSALRVPSFVAAPLSVVATQFLLAHHPARHYMRPMSSCRAPIAEVSPSEPSVGVLQQALAVLRAGDVIAFPTDTLYGLGCAYGQTQAMERIRRIRGLDLLTRPLTFVLPDVGELPRFTRISEEAYHLVNRMFPGPYCAELLAHPRVPSPLVQGERRTIGVRIPQSALCEKLIWRLGRPILTATAKSRDGHVLSTAAEIRKEYGSELDLILDGGTLNGPPSTVVSLVDDWVTVLREGLGPVNRLFGMVSGLRASSRTVRPPGSSAQTASAWMTS